MNQIQTRLDKMIAHFIGNKSLGQELIISSEPIDYNDELQEKIEHYFLSRFQFAYDQFRFNRADAERPNQVYAWVKDIFENDAKFIGRSADLANHLFNCSLQPRIKPGELFVARFNQYAHDGKEIKAIGIFKSENKGSFFQIRKNKGSLSLLSTEGIDVNKFDKGCLILETDVADGYLVRLIDYQGRGEDAKYWREDFLGLQQKNTSFSKTTSLLSETKRFVIDRLEQDFEISKADQIDLLNRSVNYFKTHEQFDRSEFEQDVFKDPEVIRSYRAFNKEEDHAKNVPDAQFEISAAAVKKQARIFKSVLKLDKNFHIYIHGNRNLIEQGRESDGRKFYKIYFENET
jgi:hypothetical protein